jgi:hypothetical protein
MKANRELDNASNEQKATPIARGGAKSGAQGPADERRFVGDTAI